MDAKEVQFANVCSSMTETPEGIVRCSSEEQLKKALLLIFVTPDGITRSLSE